MPSFALFHTLAGGVAVLAGLVALTARKGETVHRVAGFVFGVAMIATAGGGAIHAAAIPQAITAIAGAFTIYLVVTAYAAAKERRKRSGFIEAIAAIFASAVAGLSFVFALEAQSLGGAKHGFPAEAYFFFGALAAIAALGDVSALLRGGLEGRQRIARHLWRMGLGLWIAAGSLLDGPGTKIFPEVMRGTPVLTTPISMIGVLVLAWLVYALIGKRFRVNRE